MKQQSMLDVLTGVYDSFRDAGDAGNAEKMKQLILKQHKGEYILAFCGHFSAGKSTMINFLLGKDVLPSSPIPTSANTVKVQKGENYAKVMYKDRAPVIFPAPYDFKEIKKFAKDGEAVTSITISSDDFPLPDSCAIMDTPGIDSTDDAHRVSTESALHLADAVFYVMDYNHVQSEVNFLFTKELIEAGKPTYLVINMIDKHDPNELSFEDFKMSVSNAFANWSVFPDGIFYTSVRDLEREGNEIAAVKRFIIELAGKKTENESYLTSAKLLVEKHVEWLRGNLEEEHSDDLALLTDLTQEELTEMNEELDSLNSLEKSLTDKREKVTGLVEKELEAILDNAYLMPASTRDLAREYLESRQPDFKMGVFFAKKKTDAEREARKEAFLADLQEKAKTQLEWHLKEWAVKVLAEAEVHDPSLEQSAQNFELNLTEEFIRGITKAQVSITGEYVLNYTKDVSDAIKRKARMMADEFIKALFLLMDRKSEEQLQSIGTEKEKYEKFEKALAASDEMSNQVKARREELESLLSGNRQGLNPEQIGALLDAWEKEEHLVTVKTMDNITGEQDAGRETVRKTNREEKEIVKTQPKTSGQTAVGGKEKLNRTAAALLETGRLIEPLRGFHSLQKELKEKAHRLEKQTFTVALFGAFSAGKSSFANALMGANVLPVSPNPTTAAINRILAANEEHAHGTADVRLKTAEMLLADVSIALKAFGKRAATLEEAHSLAGEITAKADGREEGKTHLSFLDAFYRGMPAYKEQLGQIITVDLDGFRSFAAEESKSCLVDLIELYYDCPMTKQGMVLVDTPGADSINARHTGAAFEYIKNSDAILFVTYYNHPFSKADREFLIQLGRVKDSFAMDKMFFIVNAVDLAQTEEELEEVLDYVESQLNGFSIRFPKLFPLSSKGALAEKLHPGNFKHAFLSDSGINAFQAQFDRFIEHDLTDLAIQSAQAAIKRTEELLTEVIETSKQDGSARQKALLSLEKESEEIHTILSGITADTEKQRLKKEIDELAFYSKQRVFLRFTDFFKESFNPAVIKDDGQDHKEVLKKAAANLLEALGFDLAQEMRATSLRAEMYVQKLIKEKQAAIIQQMKKVKKSISLQEYEAKTRETPEFTRAFSNLGAGDFKKELSLFRNPKAFFEKNEKVKMAEALQKRLDEPAVEYVTEQGNRLFATYSELLEHEIVSLQTDSKEQTAEMFSGLRAVLEETVDIALLEGILQKIKQMENGE